jgi:penicillin-binding protein 2
MPVTSSRKVYVFYFLAALVTGVFIYRVGRLQLTSDEYYLKALRNSSAEIIRMPVRGTILDRDGQLIVYNDYTYDLVVIPIKTAAFDTSELCEILHIKPEVLQEKLQTAARFNRRKPSIIAKRLDPVTTALLQEKTYLYPGFYVEPKTERKYKTNGMAHILGYVNEVSKSDISEDTFYRMGDPIGVTGIEKTYEKYLRGTKGVNVVIVDKFNMQKGNFLDGLYDVEPIPGDDLHTSIDMSLQSLAEAFLANKTGSIVAIHPSTGEILCLANSPAYDPNLLTGAYRNENYKSLIQDPRVPLFNRALKSPYPPGSTFKTVQALIGQQEEVLNPNTLHSCYGGYQLGNRKVGCHAHANPVNLKYSLQTSCNAYYCHVFRNIVDHPKHGSVMSGLETWIAHLNTFGIGVLTGVDIAGESPGYLPSLKLYAKRFGPKWKSANVVSVAIGQGEVSMTPLQMANMCAIIANKGYYIRPHVVRYIGRNKEKTPEHLEKRYVSVQKEYFDIVIEGMNAAYKGGTAFWASIPGLDLCGKTGTAQNPHGKDHSVFIGFGPKEDPQIAVAILIENGGFGATWAAPMASLIMERFIKGDTITAKPEMMQRMFKPVM